MPPKLRNKLTNFAETFRDQHIPRLRGLAWREGVRVRLGRQHPSFALWLVLDEAHRRGAGKLSLERHIELAHWIKATIERAQHQRVLQ